MPLIELRIAGDPNTRQVQITGPVDDLLLAYWLLGEAKRLCEQRAAHREAAAGNGKPHLVLATDLPPGISR